LRESPRKTNRFGGKADDEEWLGVDPNREDFDVLKEQAKEISYARKNKAITAIKTLMQKKQEEVLTTTSYITITSE